MIYDYFNFFNELDLLRIRLEELKNVVDKFVLVEATRTHSGQRKPLYFQEYKHEFKEYLDRIVYYLVDDMPAIERGTGEAIRRAPDVYQKNSISKALAACNCDDNDIILISDADEFARAEKIQEAIKLLDSNDLVIFSQKFYVYYLNYIHRDNWCGTVACKYRTLKNLSAIEVKGGFGRAEIEARKCGKTKPWKLRGAAVVEKLAAKNYPHIPRGGWHFSWFGGYDSVLYKCQSYSHVEFDATDVNKLDYIKHNVQRSNLQNNKKMIERFKNINIPIHPTYCDYVEIPTPHEKDFKVDEELPGYLKMNKEKYKHFIKFAGPYEDRDIEIKFFGKWHTIKMRILNKLDRWLHHNRTMPEKIKI